MLLNDVMRKSCSGNQTALACPLFCPVRCFSSHVVASTQRDDHFGWRLSPGNRCQASLHPSEPQDIIIGFRNQVCVSDLSLIVESEVFFLPSLSLKRCLYYPPNVRTRTSCTQWFSCLVLTFYWTCAPWTILLTTNGTRGMDWPFSGVIWRKRMSEFQVRGDTEILRPLAQEFLEAPPIHQMRTKMEKIMALVWLETTGTHEMNSWALSPRLEISENPHGSRNG